MRFSFGVNVHVFIPMMLLWLKIVEMGFLFGVNAYAFITMVLFL